MNGRFGISIFQVNPKIIDYITSCIFGLSKNPVKIVKLLPIATFNKDIKFDMESDSDELESS